MTSNGISQATEHENGVAKPLQPAQEVDDLLKAVQSLIIPFIRSADEDAATKSTGHALSIPGEGPRTSLVELHKPEQLVKLMNLDLPSEGAGKEGLLATVQQVLKYSVNTWDQGFLDKLYASTNAVGVISELLLAVLNTNVHVFQVSPALTVIEKTTTKAFADLFGFSDARAGGVVTQGGSASNTTSMIIARNNLYPETKTDGNGNHKFVLFTSVHGHYSLEKAAQMCGIGSSNVWSVPVDKHGRMISSELESLVQTAKGKGFTPFYVNATAGTTVLGSFDPFTEISEICKKHNLWMHVDGSWGGPVVFAGKQKHKLAGVELADSVAVNPHKMMGVPVTCSFLLGPDISKFHKANTLPAGYLFHGGDSNEVWDLADLTLQCGRRGDSLKLALSWIYYGASGFEAQIDNAFDTATYFATEVEKHTDLVLVSENPPPCLQVCFYYAKSGKLATETQENTRMTSEIVQKLIPVGFMVDYAPGEIGAMFRVVVNRETRRGTIDGLIKAIEKAGEGI